MRKPHIGLRKHHTREQHRKKKTSTLKSNTCNKTGFSIDWLSDSLHWHPFHSVPFQCHFYKLCDASDVFKVFYFPIFSFHIDLDTREKHAADFMTESDQALETSANTQWIVCIVHRIVIAESFTESVRPFSKHWSIIWFYPFQYPTNWVHLAVLKWMCQ